METDKLAEVVSALSTNAAGAVLPLFHHETRKWRVWNSGQIIAMVRIVVY